MTDELIRSLLISSVTSSAAIALVLLLRKPVRMRFGAQAAFGLWALVPLAALSTLLPAPIHAMPMQAVTTAISQAIMIPVSTTPPVPAPIQPASWVVAIWIAGFLATLLLLAWQQLRYVRGLGRLSRIEPLVLRAETRAAGCPALLGVLRPRIILPSDFELRYDAQERALILAHEHAHRTRGDAQSNALAAVMRCVYWFNPLLHLAVSRFRFDQELACDASVIARHPGARRSYANAMLKTQLADFGMPLGCHWQSGQPLKERIAMLKRPLPNRVTRISGLLLAATVIAFATFASWAIQPRRTATANALSASRQTTGPGGSDLTTITYRRLKPISYPPAALAEGMQGVVYVRVNVVADGSVSKAELDHVDPASATVLARAAVDGVKHWTFNPARVSGKTVAGEVKVPVVFALNPKHYPKVVGADLQAIIIAPPVARNAPP